MLVFVEGGKPENPEKNPRSRTNNKLNPHMTPGPGIKPGPHWLEASALTTAPSLLPIYVICPLRVGLNQLSLVFSWNKDNNSFVWLKMGKWVTKCSDLRIIFLWSGVSRKQNLQPEGMYTVDEEKGSSKPSRRATVNIPGWRGGSRASSLTGGVGLH